MTTLVDNQNQPKVPQPASLLTTIGICLVLAVGMFVVNFLARHEVAARYAHAVFLFFHVVTICGVVVLGIGRHVISKDWRASTEDKIFLIGFGIFAFMALCSGRVLADQHTKSYPESP